MNISLLSHACGSHIIRGRRGVPNGNVALAVHELMDHDFVLLDAGGELASLGLFLTVRSGGGPSDIFPICNIADDTRGAVGLAHNDGASVVLSQIFDSAEPPPYVVGASARVDAPVSRSWHPSL